MQCLQVVKHSGILKKSNVSRVWLGNTVLGSSKHSKRSLCSVARPSLWTTWPPSLRAFILPWIPPQSREEIDLFSDIHTGC